MGIKEVILPEEIMCQAKACKSVEELIALAKENGRELTEEEARVCFERINPENGELADDELDSVSGGGLCNNSTYIYSKNGNCSACGNALGKKRMDGGRYYWYCSKCNKYSQYPSD